MSLSKNVVMIVITEQSQNSVLQYYQKMGAAQTQGVYTDIPLQHPYLRNCKAFTKNKLTFLLSSVAVQKPLFLKWKEELFAFQNQSEDSQWLMLPVKTRFDQGGVCSTTGELKLQYQFYPKLLSTQIVDRSLEKRKFNEAELWFLLYVLVTARQSLVSKGYMYGDLQPRNVFLNADQQVKVGCILSWPGEVSAYRKVMLEEDFGYLSPEDIERLKLGAMDNKNNTDSQIFAIGLTLLSASLLQPMKDLYRVKERDFDQQLFSTRVSAFQQERTYSDIYRAVVSNLLQIDLQKRMNQKQLNQFLSKHKENLVIKKPLIFDNVGKKLQQSINQLLRVVPNNRLPQQSSPPHIPIQQGIRLQRIPQPQVKEMGQKSLKQSVSRSSEKRLSNANSQKNQEIFVLPVSPRENRQAAVINNLNFGNLPPQPYFQQYPIQIPQSPKSLYPIPALKFNESQLNHPSTNKIQFISSQRSPQKFTPFEQIINKNERVFSQAALIAANGKIVTRQPNIEETKKEANSVHQSRTNELRSECEQKSLVGELNLLMETRRGANLVQVVEVKRKQKGNESKIVDPSKLSQHSIIKNSKQSQLLLQQQPQQLKKAEVISTPVQLPPKVDVENQTFLQSPKFKDPSVIVQVPQVVAKTYKEKPQMANASQPNKQSISNLPLDSNDKIVFETVSEPKKEAIKQQEDKAGKFSPLIKVWGMQKGQLTIQQFNKASQKASPQQEKEVTFSKQITVTQLKEHQKPQKSIVDSESAEKSPVPSQKSQQQHRSQLKVNPEKAKGEQNYILIEQPSHATEIEKSQINQEQVANSKVQVAPMSASEAQKRFMYVDIASNGNFQECWEQLLHMIDAPALYSAKINPDKVIPRMTEHGRFLKIGPARVKVEIHKENGKIWLQNIYGSQCEGEILCGVLKGKDLQHYIWFNSSYTYKGNHFPSRQILQEGLGIAKQNIQTRLKSSQQTH